jgi:ornithine--oxo-acid transaminase
MPTTWLEAPPDTVSPTLETADFDEKYCKYVNPQWVKLLNTLQMNAQYTHCSGTELHTVEGRVILDFLSGYCVHNTGHNHPDIIDALKAELDRRGPAMLQSHVPATAGDLAKALCDRAGGRLTKAFFSSSGSEGVESAIKFSRAHTGRSGLLYCDGAFHGLTCGALSLMGDPFWKNGFGPMLQDTQSIPFNDIQALEKAVSTRRFAAFFVEPLQSESGIRLADPDYFTRAHEICKRHGTLLVIDEVQTGLYRTGRFLCCHRYNADPDIVVVAKALSGGLVPVAATLMTDEIYASVYNSLKRSIVHTSTYSENGLSMRVGLATLEVLEREQLGERAERLGQRLRTDLRAALIGYEMVKDVRGLGLLNGIEFTAPRKLSLRVPFEAFMAIHPGMFGQVIVLHLYRDHGILAQICGNNFLTLKVAPPLVATDAQLDHFIASITEVVDQMHTSSSFWSEALGMARRVVNNI